MQELYALHVQQVGAVVEKIYDKQSVQKKTSPENLVIEIIQTPI